MKFFSKILLLLSLLIAFTGQAQTTKKTATPVKKTAAKKPAATQNAAARTAARTKAKEDSVAAVNAMAMKIARQIIAEDSLKKASAAEKAAADEKIKREQAEAELAKVKSEKAAKVKPEKSAKAKSEKKETAKVKPEKSVKEPVKKVPEELRPISQPAVASHDAKTWIGVRGTGIASVFVGDDVPSFYKPLIGYGGGIVANFGLGKHFSFQPEVLYAQEGFSIDDVINGDPIKGSVTANIIQVPLLLKYSFGEYNKGLFINVGPYGNYLINGVTNDKTFGTGKTTVKPDETTIDYGVAGGLGVAVPLGIGRLLLEIRGTYYLGSTVKEDNSTNTKIVTGAFSVGYLFPIGH